MATNPKNPINPAEQAFLDFLRRNEADAGVDFESFCAERPELAPELRECFAAWQTLARVLEERRGPDSIAKHLEKLYDQELDPDVFLDADSAVSGVGITAESEGVVHAVRSPRYELRGKIAEGGMGTIIKVWDPNLRRHLALKTIAGRQRESSDSASHLTQARLVHRFLEEAQITGQLVHPGIVPVHDLGIDSKGRVYFTMRLVRGRDFEEILELLQSEEDGWTRTRALRVLLTVCEAVAFAHSKGVVHRDLKPANVMVGKFGETYVMDWGLARVLAGGDTKDVRPRRDAAASTVVATERADVREESPSLSCAGSPIARQSVIAALRRLMLMAVGSPVSSTGEHTALELSPPLAREQREAPVYLGLCDSAALAHEQEGDGGDTRLHAEDQQQPRAIDRQRAECAAVVGRRGAENARGDPGFAVGPCQRRGSAACDRSLPRRKHQRQGNDTQPGHEDDSLRRHPAATTPAITGLVRFSGSAGALERGSSGRVSREQAGATVINRAECSFESRQKSDCSCASHARDSRARPATAPGVSWRISAPCS